MGRSSWPSLHPKSPTTKQAPRKPPSEPDSSHSSNAQHLADETADVSLNPHATTARARSQPTPDQAHHFAPAETHPHKYPTPTHPSSAESPSSAPQNSIARNHSTP